MAQQRNYSPRWDRLYRTQPESFRHYPNEEFVRFMGRHFFSSPPSKRKGIRILEVGCGNAANLWMVAKEGFQAFGMDGSTRGLQLARQTLKRWKTTARLKLASLLELQYPDAFFDAVFDVRALECLSYHDHKQAFREVSRVLKPRGWFFSFHGGMGSWDFRNGGGRRIDAYTLHDVPNPKAIFPKIGTICLPSSVAIKRLVRGAGFDSCSVELVEKTYSNRSKRFQYLVVEARNRNHQGKPK